MFSRAKAFFKGLFPQKFTDEDEEFVRAYLNKQQQILFYRMQYIDQRHALDTAYKLKELIGRRVKIDQDKMYLAALLHDVGKVALPITLTERVIQNLFFMCCKPVANWLASNGNRKYAGRLKKVLYYSKNHANNGAKLVRELRINENVAYLIEHHHDEPAASEPLELTLLREADKYS